MDSGDIGEGATGPGAEERGRAGEEAIMHGVSIRVGMPRLGADDVRVVLRPAGGAEQQGGGGMSDTRGTIWYIHNGTLKQGLARSTEVTYTHEDVVNESGDILGMDWFESEAQARVWWADMLRRTISGIQDDIAFGERVLEGQRRELAQYEKALEAWE
ncbi:MAG: hypothetical protein Q7O66_01130 [Dehalococcoidia bacterium]|nr:hypothetical protein [Dehalococcoidia bacterium]